MSSNFKLDFNVSDFLDATKKLDKAMTKELRLANKRSASDVESYAKANHRFTTRTGRLVKSIVGFSSIAQYGFGAEVGVRAFDDSGNILGTDYGIYVHEGHGSWGADKFIDKALAKNLRKIQERWKKAIDVASKDF
jgi:hypothetical protein